MSRGDTHSSDSVFVCLYPEFALKLHKISASLLTGDNTDLRSYNVEFDIVINMII